MITLQVANEAWRPTIRATPLRPVLVITSGLLLIGVVTSWRTEALPGVLGVVGVGGVAAGVALGLDDEARTLLRSSPTCALLRLGHRLAILVPALIASVVTLFVVERLLFAEQSTLPTFASLSALVVAGIAVEVWWSRHRPETAAEGAAIVVMSWTIAPSLLPGVSIVDRLGGAWQTDAVSVFVISLVLVVAGTAGRDA